MALIADVAVPLLDFSERTLEFHHAYEKGAAIDVIKRPITLRWGGRGGRGSWPAHLMCGREYDMACASETR